MATSLKSLFKTVLLTSLAVTVPIVGIRFLGGFEGSELAAYDDFIRRRPAETPDDRIVIVTISDDDIDQLQQFPIHDGTLAEALKILESGQPRAIGLDISRDVPHGLPAGRDRLTQVIKQSETIITGCLLSTANHPGSPPAPGTPPGGAAFADFPQDVDKIVRRTKLISTPAQSNKRSRTNHDCNDVRADNEIPSLSFQVALMYLEGVGIKPDSTATNEIQFRQTVLRRIDPQFGGYVRADAPDYQLMLNYRGTKRVFREIPMLDLLQKKVDPQLIRDRVVLIGYNSEVSKDELNTPYSETRNGSRTMPGVVVHAHAVSQILSAVLDQRPLIRSWSNLGEVLWIFAWSIGSGLLAFYNRRLGLFLIGLVGFGLALWGICYGVFLAQGLWVPFVPTLSAVILTALAVRVLDLASRSGYTQAIYEQIRDQVQGQGSSRDRRGDYLENLVQRARTARQGQTAAELLSLGTEPLANATPEMQALYQQIAAQVKADVKKEQSVKQTAIAQPRNSSKTSRIQNLLSRAQETRSAHSPDADTGTIIESHRAENNRAVEEPHD
ncbi:MAG: transmembrane sensor domain protein [Leptolyngbya sp.]|nr:MAG: transmembrane sensor domain protein [Leptolyngbya sp.]